MPIHAIKGIVENGKVRLTENISLPENANVYVIVENSSQSLSAQIRTPRLANPKQAADFRKQIVEISDNASI